MNGKLIILFHMVVILTIPMATAYEEDSGWTNGRTNGKTVGTAPKKLRLRRTKSKKTRQKEKKKLKKTKKKRNITRVNIRVTIRRVDHNAKTP